LDATTARSVDLFENPDFAVVQNPMRLNLKSAVEARRTPEAWKE
jgi:hypothetical protein